MSGAFREGKTVKNIFSVENVLTLFFLAKFKGNINK